MNRIGLMLVIAPLLVLAIHYGSEMVVVNQCIDAGGSFNYSTMACSFTERTANIPYSERYRWSVNVAVGVSFVGLLIALVGGRRQRVAELGARHRGTGVRSRALN